MTKPIEDNLSKIPIINWIVKLGKQIKIFGFEGMSFYDLLEMYFIGIFKGALTSRAGAISFSFFMAIFPFLLFVLNLIPFITIENFHADFTTTITSLLPSGTVNLFQEIIQDIVLQPRGALLYSTLVLAIFLIANGVNAIFAGFENSYHVVINRNFIKQYLYSLGVGVLLAVLFILTIVGIVYFEILVVNKLDQLGYISDSILWINIGKNVFFILMIYLITAILYYFGTVEGKKTKFFSPGALLTTIMILLTTYLFKIYITNFSQYNQLYGSLGALLILMLYIWLNSIILLLGFELNASINRLKLKHKIEKK